MSEFDSKRRDVAVDYANVLKSKQSCCCKEPAPKGAVARLAGYSQAELEALPPEVVVNSFGCGDPLAFSAVEPGQVVLDLGSGAGIDLLLAARKVGPQGRVIGVDMTEEMLAAARQNALAAGLSNVELRQGLIEQLPVDDAAVDWVISNCVINLSPEKDRVFSEIARVLVPGGRMLVADITAEQLPAEIAGNRRLHSSCLAGAISQADYLAGLRRAGLQELEVVDRLVYDADQIRAFIDGGLHAEDGGCCGGAPIDPDQAQRWAAELAGAVASIKVRGRKPA